MRMIAVTLIVFSSDFRSISGTCALERRFPLFLGNLSKTLIAKQICQSRSNVVDERSLCNSLLRAILCEFSSFSLHKDIYLRIFLCRIMKRMQLTFKDLSHSLKVKRCTIERIKRNEPCRRHSHRASLSVFITLIVLFLLRTRVVSRISLCHFFLIK